MISCVNSSFIPGSYPISLAFSSGRKISEDLKCVIGTSLISYLHVPSLFTDTLFSERRIPFSSGSTCFPFDITFFTPLNSFRSFGLTPRLSSAEFHIFDRSTLIFSYVPESFIGEPHSLHLTSGPT